MKNMNNLLNKIICHRGIYDNMEIYENTLNAFELALKLNLPIEFDLRILKDNTIIVFHDENCKKLLNYDHDIEKMTYEEVCYISKYKIPTFEETLKLINGKVPILIELKTKKYKKNNFINRVIELLNDYHGEFYIQSFFPKHLKYIEKIKPEYIIGLLIGKKKEHNLKKYDFINVNIKLLDDKKIRKIKENIKVLGYGISKKEEYLRKIEVYDNLVCDNVLDILEK